MAEPKRMREQVIRAAATLFRERGYHQTSMSMVAQACGIQKATLFHHITNRETLLLAVLDQEYTDIEVQILGAASSCGSSNPQVRLRALAKAFREYFVKHNYQCLLMLLSSELCGEMPEFQARVVDYLGQIIERIVVLLHGIFSEEQARCMIEDIFAQSRGAMMLQQVTGDTLPFERVVQKLGGLLD